MVSYGAALIGTSLTASIIIVVALLTPGWISITNVGTEYDTTISVSAVYLRVCVKDSDLDMLNCETVSLWGNVEKMENEATLRWLAEGLGCLIATGIGCIMAVMLGWAMRRQNNQNTRSTSNGCGYCGLVSVIIGAVCGVIFAIESIIASQYVGLMFTSQTQYSLIIFGVGLLVQILAIIFHIVCMRTSYAGVPAGGMVLAPCTNPPSQVFVHTSSTVTQPYVQF